MTEQASKKAGPLLAADLGSVERAFLRDKGSDLTEAKEALVDGLVGLTVERCTGDGPDGDYIYGVKPSSRLVSGFLMPRFDSTGQDDETSDIHLATMGVDLQLAAENSGEIVVRPRLSIYVRILPSWEEINDPRHDMVPQVQLSRETRQQVEDRARQIIDEAIAKLPPLPDIEEADENPGDVTAEATQAREEADDAKQRLVEGDANDKDAQGNATALAIAAERVERMAELRRASTSARQSARKERNTTIASIRRGAFDQAFAELGIQLTHAGAAESDARPVRADDLVETTAAAENEEVDLPAAETSGDEPASAAGASAVIQPGAGVLDDHHAAQQPIPQKWRRIRLDIGELRFDYANAASRQVAIDEFATRCLAAARTSIETWLADEAGQRAAYRPGERILPSQFASKESWERYLAALILRRPAVVADVLPNLQGLGLVVEADGDFVDPSRTNLRIALENGADTPPRATFFDTESSVFQVGLEIDLPRALHKRLRLDRVQTSYRFRDWLDYPAMGLNCGVEEVGAAADVVCLRTTCAPRYTQPRIEPRTIPGVPTSYVTLADEKTDLSLLLELPNAYDSWTAVHAGEDAGQGLPKDDGDRERRQHAIDIEAYRRESRFIREGVKLLMDSRAAALAMATAAEKDRPHLKRLAAPWEAWLRTNETFALYGKERFTDWRLFQLAFILAHVPTLASRMPEYEDRFEPARDELSASLLYFATGGGKSEAFFGLLLFNLFLDRLRGKHRGVTALVRYPLRLLRSL